eukprot:TRINITY_DN19195_c0_g1_i1.p1 TRINITY_DN19195_c0_g1~~TRINITY_DN19195_c0_g1_i1.p1  ORF type:complete len:184 (-),score=27.85 TRINITY_DN19195_c0_g1_i1:466-1017(-)
MDQASTIGDQVKGLTEPHINIVNAGEGIALWVLGVLVVFKALGNETGGSYSLFEDFVPDGAGPPAHIHTKEDETWYLLDGELYWYVGGKEFHATKGSFIHLPKFVPHTFANKSGKVAHMVLTYAPAGLENWFINNGKAAEDINDFRPPKLTKADVDRAISSGKEYGLIVLPAQEHSESQHSEL